MGKDHSLMLEWLKAGREGNDRGWDGRMASPTQWTWAWVSSGSWWWTGKPGILQSKGSQRVGHNWTTELNWTEFLSYSVNNFRNKTHHWNGSYLVLWYTVWEQETTINIWFLSIWNVTVKTEICCVCKMHPGFQKQYAKENIKYLISIFMWKWKSLSLVRLFVTPWTVA